MRIVYRYLPIKTLFERNQRFGSLNTLYRLKFVEYPLQMFIIVCVYLDKNRIVARRVMTFGNFDNLVQLFHHRFEQAGSFEKDTHEGTGMVSHDFGIENKFRTFNESEPGEPLYALMYRSARNTTFAGYFKVWNPRVGTYHRQYFSV